MAPNITEYNPNIVGPRPSETGAEAAAMTARHINATSSEVAASQARTGQVLGGALKEAGDAALAFQDHNQINAGADNGSKLWATLQDSWNQTSANANLHDPNVARNWRETVLEPALQEFTSGSGYFTTQKSQDWANGFANRLRDHYFATTEADMSRAAKDAALETVTNLGTNLSNTAFKDPSAVGSMLGMVDHTVDSIIAANPNIKGADAAALRAEVAEKLKRQVVQAGGYGVVFNAPDPEKAVDNFSSRWPDYISGSDAKALARGAQIQAKQNQYYSNAVALQAKQKDVMDMHASLNDASDKFVTYDAQGNAHVDPRFIDTVNGLPKNFPNAPEAWKTKEELGKWIHAQQTNPKGGATDVGTLNDLNSRFFADNNPTSQMDLMRAQVAGKLSNQDFTRLDKLVKLRDSEPTDPVFKATMAQVRDKIEGTIPTLKAVNAPKYNQFLADFMDRYLRLRRANMLEPNALNLNDENSLISQVLKQYQQNLGDTIKANGGVGAPAAPPLKSNGYAIPGQT